MKVIVLAAGHSKYLDGFNKLLIKDPKTSLTILDNYIEIFGKENLTIVLGHRALEVMNVYPYLNFIYNHNWVSTNNSSSLSLALDDQPCLVISSDLFIKKEIIDLLYFDDCILTQKRESREITTLNCKVEDSYIKDIYKGAIKDTEDPEIIGVFKISSHSILKSWKNNCLNFPNLFIGENINFSQFNRIINVDMKDKYKIFEINTVLDYINFIQESK